MSASAATAPSPRAARVERDPLGELRVPADAYYGVQTQRAVENFPISGLTRARAARHRDRPRSRRPRRAPTRRSAASTPTSPAPSSAPPTRSSAGRLRDQFVVDVYQAGAGTSHNMNTNEVLANRAAEMLGGATRRVHARPPQRSRQHGTVDQRRLPDGDAARVLLVLPGACSAPRRALADGAATPRAREFAGIAQDRAHAPAGCRADHVRPGVRRLRRQRARTPPTELRRSAEALHELNLGATAVGTGLNAGDDYTRSRDRATSPRYTRLARPACARIASA